MSSKQIICLKCAAKYPLKDYPGEWHHQEQGKARGFENGDFVCDFCNVTIPKGTECVAQSFGRDRDPYQPWEHDFLGEAPGMVDGTIRVIDKEGVHEYPPDKREDIKL